VTFNIICELHHSIAIWLSAWNKIFCT